MASRDRIEELIRKGLRFLGGAQEPDGGFANFSSPDPNDLTAGLTYRTTFVPSLILCSLNRLSRTADLDAIRAPLASFLMAQRNAAGSLNYWSRTSPEYASMAYPDDLDDTFTALAGLHGYDPDLLGGTGTAAAIRLLTACEERPGGPYRSWLVSADAEPVWKDVDPAVNANVAFFLAQHDVRITGITALQENAISSGIFGSPYYHGWQPVAYFTARSYRGPKQGDLGDWIRSQRKEGGYGGTAQTALAVSSLLLLGAPASEVSGDIEVLAKHAANGWQADAVIRDPYIKGVLHYAGCPALTAAFCLEAFALYLEKSGSDAKVPAPSAEAATARIEADTATLPKSMVPGLREATSRVLGTENGAKLLGLPAFLAKALRVTAPEALLEDLSLITAYGWIAYTIHDDFLDDEGVPALLPVGALAQRRLVSLVHGVDGRIPGFAAAAHAILDRLDSANRWEVTACRRAPSTRISLTADLPDYGDLSPLAERSLGHSLPALALIAAAGHPIGGTEWAAISEFFKQYLIARQLNDDAHDWKEDLERGHVTYAAAELIKDQRGAGKKAATFKELESTYWNVTVTRLCREILARSAAAKASLAPLGDRIDAKALGGLLAPYERAATAALDGHRRTGEFITAYGGEA